MQSFGGLPGGEFSIAQTSRRKIVLSGLTSLGFARAMRADQFKPATPSQPATEGSTSQSVTPNQGNRPTFSTNVRVVNVFATVRDKQGKIVDDLTKDDFVLQEDERPQTIRYFSRQTDLPLTLGLLIDTSMSERRMLGQERDASRTFLEQVLRPEKDKAFLIHFDREVELLQDLTASRERLEKALDSLDRPQWNGSGGSTDPDNDPGNQGGGGNGGYGGQGSGGRRGGHGGTALYDAIYLASNDLMQKQQGRKALILLTDGEDNGSKESISEAISSAQRADTLAYSVRIADEQQPFRGLGGPGMGRHGGMGGGGWGGGGMGGGGGQGRGGPWQNRPDGKKILQQISKETGGGYFEVSKKKTVEDIYKEIETELRNQYSIGYTSDGAPTDTQFRTIQLRVKRKGLIVQARGSYYPVPSS